MPHIHDRPQQWYKLSKPSLWKSIPPLVKELCIKAFKAIKKQLRSSAFNGVLLTPAFTFDQNFSIGFKNGEYGGKYRHL